MYRPNSSRGGNSNGGGGHNRENSSYGSNGRSSFGNGGGGGGSFSNGGNQQRKQNEEIFLNKPVWNSSTMKPFEKEFYKEHSSVYNRSSNDLNDFLRTNNVSLNGTKFIKPILEFNECGIPETILEKIRDAKYDKPTPIQSMCWPTLLSGNDMVGIAQTGSGKTLGFVLPMLLHISNNQRYMKSLGNGRDDIPGPIGLVLAPTRELAQQIQKTAEEFGNYTGIKNIVIYGGASKIPQTNQIKRGAELYIATPGRLLDFLKENTISLNRCTYLVLDEADRMLDMGFEPQIRKIIEQIRPDRQTAMFSATWPKEVRKLAEDFISNYVHITIGASELTANPNIKQIVEVCEESNKENRLREILSDIMNYRDAKAIIFAETKRRVDTYSKFIRDLGYHCLTIHGDKKQMEREWVLSEFKKKPRSILCATDVAARGINVEDIKYVINIDYPVQTEDYIHRIGRTARNSNSGTSFTFITNDNARHLPKLIEVLRETNQYISDGILEMARSFSNKNGGRSFSKPYGQSNGGGYQGRPKYNQPQNNYNNGGGGSSGGSSYNENTAPDRMNSMPRKRDSSEMNNGSSGDGGYRNSDNNNNSSGERNGRVKKFRWDDGPATPQSQQNNSRGGNNNNNGGSNGSYGSNGASNNRVGSMNGSQAGPQSLMPLNAPPMPPQSGGSQIYGPYPPQIQSKLTSPVAAGAVPPPPPPPAQISPSTAQPAHVMATAAYPADYSSVYNMQYYQAMAAAAATNNGGAGAAGWQTAAAYQNWKPATK